MNVTYWLDEDHQCKLKKAKSSYTLLTENTTKTRSQIRVKMKEWEKQCTMPILGNRNHTCPRSQNNSFKKCTCVHNSLADSHCIQRDALPRASGGGLPLPPGLSLPPPLSFPLSTLLVLDFLLFLQHQASSYLRAFTLELSLSGL